jgi:hypothetical protein
MAIMIASIHALRLGQKLDLLLQDFVDMIRLRPL